MSRSTRSTLQSPQMASLIVGLLARALGISTVIAVVIATAVALF